METRRVVILAACCLLLAPAGCKRNQKIRVQQTEEEQTTLATVLHVADPRAGAQLLSGFYDVEQNAWRWTMGSFSVLLRPPKRADQEGAILQLRFTVPDAVLAKLKTISLSATVNGTGLTPESYTQPGEFTYSREVPARLLAGEAVKVEFKLDKFLPPSDLDQRELGVIVTMVGFEVK